MRLSNKIVRERLRETFGDEYDLSKVNYINKNENIILICKKHGEFSARLNAFTKRGQRCQNCKKDEQLLFYNDYLKSNHPHISFLNEQLYENSKQKLTFYCNKHGAFKQTWNSITRGTHCPKCGATRLKNKQSNRIIPIDDVIKRIDKVSNKTIKVVNPEEYVNSHSKLIYQCIKGHTWSVKLYQILQGKGCAKCAGLRITTEEFIETIKEKHFDKLKLVEGQKYRGRKYKLKFKCNVSSHPVFIASPSNIVFSKGGNGCPECKKDRLRNIFSYSTDEVYKKIEKKFNGRITALPNQVYKNQKTRWVFKCKVASHLTWEANIGSVLSGEYKYGCRQCMGERAIYSFDDIKNLIFERFGDKITLTKVHGKRFLFSSKVTVHCNKHKKSYCEKLSNILNSIGCPDCSIESRQKKRRTDKEKLITQVFEIHREFISIVNPDDYVNTDTKLIFKCHKKLHGTFNAAPHSIISGSGCPICKMSRGERKILFWLRDNNIIHEYQFRTKKHTGKGHFIFDFILPENKMIIEYDGRQHFVEVDAWGGKEALKNIKKVDRMKNDYSKIKGFKMLRIHYLDYDKISKILEKEILI